MRGIRCLAGIPGDVGGTPVQNVGAYGQEVAETIAKVRAYDLETKKFVDLDHGACHFGYRRSLFNADARGRYIVTSVIYKLHPNGEPALRYADVKRYFAANRTRQQAHTPPGLRCRAFHSRTKGMLAGQAVPTVRAQAPSSKIP